MSIAGRVSGMRPSWVSSSTWSKYMCSSTILAPSTRTRSTPRPVARRLVGGISPSGDASETFKVENGVAKWKSPSDAGEAPWRDNLAYVIFTSGSTGRPKGAMNTHAGICNRLLWMQSAYGLTPEDRVLQKTPFTFDVSVWELFWPLAVGACLVVAEPERHKESVEVAPCPGEPPPPARCRQRNDERSTDAQARRRNRSRSRPPPRRRDRGRLGDGAAQLDTEGESGGDAASIRAAAADVDQRKELRAHGRAAVRAGELNGLRRCCGHVQEYPFLTQRAGQAGAGRANVGLHYTTFARPRRPFARSARR